MWKERIVKKLLTKYEKSRSYQKQAIQSRKIAITPKQIGTFNLEDYDHKSALIEDVKALKELGFVGFEWVEFEEDNLIKRIWLVQDPDAVDLAYAYVGRKVTFKGNFDLYDWLISSNFDYYEWINDYCNDLVKVFDRTGKFGNKLFQKADQSKLFLECLQKLDTLKGDVIHERMLSVQVFNDSKAFQKVYKSKLISLLKKYVEDLDETDPLSWVGIRTNPECLQFSGNICIALTSGTFDARVFKQGAVMLAREAVNITSIQGDHLHGILFVENQASYESLLEQRPDNWLVVYHGGFASKAKKQFFQALYQAFPDQTYYHWSDIDLGGVRIFDALQKIIPIVKPLCMRESTLKKYMVHATRYSGNYRELLTKYQSNNTNPEVAQLLNDLIKTGLRLEQEHVEIGDVLVQMGEIN